MRPTPLRSILLLALVPVSLGAVPAHAVNLLRNPTFDSDISQWSTGNSNLTLSWSAADADASPSSGSIEVRNHDPVDNGGSPSVLSSCPPVTSGTSYRAGAVGKVPNGQSHTGFLTVFLFFYSSGDCTGATVGSTPNLAIQGNDDWSPMEVAGTAPATARSAQVWLGVRKVGDGGEIRAFFDNAFLEEKTGLCTPDPTTLCLDHGRFAATVSWRDGAGGEGPGMTKTETDDSGLFWFFSESNLEMLVKVLDGCSFTDHYWVFAAATTDVEYTLTVRDLATSDSKSYTNPLGTRSPAITDTEAFATCP